MSLDHVCSIVLFEGGENAHQISMVEFDQIPTCIEKFTSTSNIFILEGPLPRLHRKLGCSSCYGPREILSYSNWHIDHSTSVLYGIIGLADLAQQLAVMLPECSGQSRKIIRHSINPL